VDGPLRLCFSEVGDAYLPGALGHPQVIVVLGFAVETGSFGRLDQVLVVRCPMNLILSGLQSPVIGLQSLFLFCGRISNPWFNKQVFPCSQKPA
jgi:hypothetical protein